MNKALLTVAIATLCSTGFADEASRLSICGTLKPHASCKVGAQVGGRIEKVLCEEGQTVEEGQVLVELDTTFFELEVKRQSALYQNAQVAYEEAKLDAERMTNLWDKPDPAIPKKLYDEAQFRLRQKKNTLIQASAELKASQVRLKEASVAAPFSGIITHCYIDRGDSIATAPPTEIVELIDSSRLTLEFSAPQERIGTLKVGAPVTFQIEGDLGTYTAKVTKVIPVIDEKTRSFRCQAEVENPDYVLKAGAFVRGTVEPGD